MKVRIEIETDLADTEVIVRCNKIDEQILQLQKVLTEMKNASKQLTFYKNDTEYYLPLTKVLFFDTESGSISAHTANEVYQVKYKLYELEELLPGYFMRVSKSTILNTYQVYSITKNITAASTVTFEKSHKQVYVSRNFYKSLKLRLEEKRLK